MAKGTLNGVKERIWCHDTSDGEEWNGDGHPPSGWNGDGYKPSMSP